MKKRLLIQVICCLTVLSCAVFAFSACAKTIAPETAGDPSEETVSETAAGTTAETTDEPVNDVMVSFSIDAGANIEGKTVELYAPDGFDIYFTTDGSDPTASSQKYTEPLSLKANESRFAAESDNINFGERKIYDDDTLPKAITLKAISVDADGIVSPVATRTYFFQDREPVIVIALSTDYANLLDYDTGIMVKGAIYDAWINTPEAQEILASGKEWTYQANNTQSGKDWERPVTIEIFDDLYGTETYILDKCGIRLRGYFSRVFAQKAFNFYFKDSYGSKELEYPLFDDAKDINGELLTSYKGFMLRNGGNDTEYLKFHDTLILNLVKDLNFATQVSRPAVLYINGEYMGIYVLQEKFSDKYLADHYKVDKKNVILIEESEIDEGEDSDIAFYEEMRSYADKDLSDAQTYDEFCSIVDIDSMIDYYATEIYIGNDDWDPIKNTRLWRVRTPENNDYGDGRWRWILYDTEYSASMYYFAETRYDYNSFAAAQGKDPLFASVIKNPDFYEKFSEKIRFLGENIFTPDKVNAEVDRLADIYKPYMPDYYKRFGDTSWAWNSNINGIEDFFAKRSPFILGYVQNYQP